MNTQHLKDEDVYKLRKEKQKISVHVLKDQMGVERSKQEELKKIIQEFYANLYQKQEIDKTIQKGFLGVNTCQ